jgi:hypothetical protein
LPDKSPNFAAVGIGEIRRGDVGTAGPSEARFLITPDGGFGYGGAYEWLAFSAIRA